MSSPTNTIENGDKDEENTTDNTVDNIESQPTSTENPIENTTENTVDKTTENTTDNIESQQPTTTTSVQNEEITFDAAGMTEFLREDDEDQEGPADKDLPKQTTDTNNNNNNNENEENAEESVEGSTKVKKKKEKKPKVKRIRKHVEETYKEIEPTEVGNYSLGDLIRTRIVGEKMKSTLEREKALKDNRQSIINHNRRQQIARREALENGTEYIAPQLGNNQAAVEFINGQLVAKQGNPDESTMDGEPVLYEGGDHITNNSFGNRSQSRRWSKEETAFFLSQLKRYGTDFSVLEKVVPNRDRRQLKLKFKKEQRDNPNLLNEIISGKITFSMEEYKTLKGKADSKRKEKEESKKLNDQLNGLTGNIDDDGGGEDDDDYYEEYKANGGGSGLGGILGGLGSGLGGSKSSGRNMNRYQEEVVMDSAQYEKQQAQQAAQSIEHDPFSMTNDYYGTNDYDY